MNNCRFMPQKSHQRAAFLHGSHHFKTSPESWHFSPHHCAPPPPPSPCPPAPFLLIVFSPLRDPVAPSSAPPPHWLLSQAWQHRAIEAASFKWSWQGSQGVVIRVDMQINILHHQSLVGRACGQDVKMRPMPVSDSDRRRSQGEPVSVQRLIFTLV